MMFNIETNLRFEIIMKSENDYRIYDNHESEFIMIDNSVYVASDVESAMLTLEKLNLYKR